MFYRRLVETAGVSGGFSGSLLKPAANSTVLETKKLKKIVLEAVGGTRRYK